MSVLEPAVAGLPLEPISPLKDAWTVYRRNTAAVFGTLLLLTIVAFVLYGTFIYKGDPYEIVWAPQTPPGQSDADPQGSAPGHCVRLCCAAKTSPIPADSHGTITKPPLKVQSIRGDLSRYIGISRTVL